LPAFLFLAACGAILGLCFIRAPETRDVPLSLNETDSGEETWQALGYLKGQTVMATGSSSLSSAKEARQN
jgi:hypothetical protein